MGVHPVHGASHGLGSTENLLHRTGELLGHGAGCHHTGGGDDVIHGDVAAVLDVLHLLAVPWGLLQRLDDQGSSRGDNRAGGLPEMEFQFSELSGSSTEHIPVLDLQLDSDLEALPVGGCLGDVVTNLLWGQTQWTHLVKIEMRTRHVACKTIANA